MRIDYTTLPNDKIILILSETGERREELARQDWSTFVQRTGVADVIITSGVVHVGPPEEGSFSAGEAFIEVKPRIDIGEWGCVEDVLDQLTTHLRRGSKLVRGYTEAPEEIIDPEDHPLVPSYHEDSLLVDIVSAIRYEEAAQGGWDEAEESLKRAWRKVTRDDLESWEEKHAAHRPDEEG